MPAYIGSKKVKELYYGGKKIKEAWLNGKKVYSQVGKVRRGWVSDFYYEAGDRNVFEGYVYECIKSHWSEYSNKPGYGWDQYTYWKQIGYEYEFEF